MQIASFLSFSLLFSSLPFSFFSPSPSSSSSSFFFLIFFPSYFLFFAVPSGTAGKWVKADSESLFWTHCHFFLIDRVTLSTTSFQMWSAGCLTQTVGQQKNPSEKSWGGTQPCWFAKMTLWRFLGHHLIPQTTRADSPSLYTLKSRL